MSTTKVKHTAGKYISYAEREENPFLRKYQNIHSLCGKLFLLTDKVTFEPDPAKVTCKNCLKVLNEQPRNKKL